MHVVRTCGRTYVAPCLGTGHERWPCTGADSPAALSSPVIQSESEAWYAVWHHEDPWQSALVGTDQNVTARGVVQR